MKDMFIKIYIYIVLVNAIVNLIFGLIYYLNQNFITLILLNLISLPELLILPASIALIIYILIKKLNRLHLILPTFFFSVYIGMSYWGLVQNAKGVYPLDLSNALNFIMFFATVLFYVAHIIMGAYLLKIKK